jgi:hypothetical protein
LACQNNTVTPCGLFGWSLFCPFKCGFFKRLFRIGNCTNKKIEPVPVPTSVLVPLPAPVLVPVPLRAPVPVPVPVSAPTQLTKAPTNAPITLTTQSLLTSFINNITLSNRTIVANGPTPEDQALNYLIVNDTTFNFTQLLTLNSMMTNMVQFRIRQRYALLTLWFQQAFTNTTWRNGYGWLENANECDNDNSWKGITCTSIDLKGDVGMQNVVTAVNLNFNNVNGTIPPDLGLLTALTYFDVYRNALIGTLPASIGQWTALRNIDVGENALTGTLPASIGQWTALTYFGVYDNKMTGTIPASIGNWSQIRKAYFYFNQLTGSMPNGICPYINTTILGQLEADCKSEINCTCCTYCS